MNNDISQYKNPYKDVHQYVAPEGWHFERSGINYGRIMWMSNVEGIILVKDDN